MTVLKHDETLCVCVCVCFLMIAPRGVINTGLNRFSSSASKISPNA
jgi:hypothetical protein